VTRGQGIDPLRSGELCEVDMSRFAEDVPEDGRVGVDMLADADLGPNMPVLECAAAANVDLHPVRLNNLHGSGFDGIDGGAVGGRDVDSEVELECSAAVKERRERRRPGEDPTRVAEAPADGMRSIEGLDRPTVRIRPGVA